MTDSQNNMGEGDEFSWQEDEESIPAMLDDLNPAAPLVQRLQDAGPEVNAILDEMIKEAGLPVESVEWPEDEGVADEVMEMAEDLANGENSETREELVERIRRLMETH